MSFRRYAIYYTPKPGPLADFGATWLGWDIATGLPVAHPIILGLQEDIREITASPRKYGFHGTIKPPFFLAESTTESDLRSEFVNVAKSLQPIEMDGLELSQLGRFLALTVKGETRALSAMASHVVKALDAFRAPPSTAELARRRQSNLSPRQENNLKSWGYPYVMEDFKFHLTLTGRLNRLRAADIKTVLEPALVNTLPSPFKVSDLTLVGEDTNGRFYEIERVSFSTE